MLGIFSGLLSQLVFIKLLAGRISVNDFSLYAFIFQIAAYFNILQIGMDFTASREIAFCLGKSNNEEATSAFYLIKRFNKKLFIIGMCVIACLSLLFFFKKIIPDNADPQKAILLLIFFGFSQLINFLCRPSLAALIGSNNQSIANLNNVLVSISSTCVAIFFLFYSRLSLLSMPVSLCLINVINYFFLKKYITHKCSSWLVLNEKFEISTSAKSKLFKLSILSAIGGLGWTIESTSDVFILNNAGLFSLVGIYVVWWRFPQMLFDLATRFTTSAFPALTKSFGSSVEENVTLFNKILYIITGFALSIGVGIALLLPDFIKLWVGSKFIPDNAEFLPILIGLVVVFRIIGNLLGFFIMSHGHFKQSSVFAWVQAIVKVGLALLLVKNYGIAGLLTGSAFAAFLQIGLHVIYLGKQKFVTSASVLLLFTPLLFLLIIYLCSLFNFNDIVFKILLGILTLMACCILVFYKTGLYKRLKVSV